MSVGLTCKTFDVDFDSVETFVVFPLEETFNEASFGVASGEVTISVFLWEHQETRWMKRRGV